MGPLWCQPHLHTGVGVIALGDNGAMKIIPRDIPPRGVWALEKAGIHPLLARLYAARGVTGTEELDDALAKLLPPTTMKGLPEAA